VLQISAGVRLRIGQSLIAFTSSGTFPYNQLFDIYVLPHPRFLENTDGNNIRYPGVYAMLIRQIPDERNLPFSEVYPVNWTAMRVK
jgi:hypothetical protein